MTYQPPSTDQLFPILGQGQCKADWASIDLNACPDDDLGTHDGLSHCVGSQIRREKATFGFGGYLEKRNIYRRSTHFTAAEELRDIHLGCDIWGPVGQPIFAPLKGIIHSYAFNAQPFDYGATIIVRHLWKETHCYALYGHLQKSDLDGIQVGDQVDKGQEFCHMGNLNENGGWVPHLHFQLILEIDDNKGDYPGVAARSQLPYYRNNCPDPTLWIV